MSAPSSEIRHKEKLARRAESRARRERRQAQRQERDKRLRAAYLKYRAEAAAIWEWWRSL